jgi:succinate dehydrogenase / fumarate reductase, cytochrome b subunit
LDVKNLLYVLMDDLGVEAVKQAVERPLERLKFAPFGCHLLRPSSLRKYREGLYNPHSLGLLVEDLGGKELKYESATKGGERFLV